MKYPVLIRQHPLNRAATCANCKGTLRPYDAGNVCPDTNDVLCDGCTLAGLKAAKRVVEMTDAELLKELGAGPRNLHEYADPSFCVICQRIHHFMWHDVLWRDEMRKEMDLAEVRGDDARYQLLRKALWNGSYPDPLT